MTKRRRVKDPDIRGVGPALRRAAKAQPPDTAKEDGPEWAFGSEADESLPDPFANNE